MHIYFSSLTCWCALSFHILAIVNNAAMNMKCGYFYGIVISFYLDIYPELTLLDHIWVYFLICWGPSMLLATMAAQITISTKRVHGSIFSTPSPSQVISCLFENSRSFAHFVNRLVVGFFCFFFLIELYMVLTYLRYESLIRCVICKYFLPFQRLAYFSYYLWWI